MLFSVNRTEFNTLEFKFVDVAPLIHKIQPLSGKKGDLIEINCQNFGTNKGKDKSYIPF